jgi:hypothetical protein
MEHTDLKDSIRAAITREVTDVGNYPDDIAVLLWGERLDELVEAVTDAVVSSLPMEYGVVVIGASYNGSDEVWWYPTEEERDSMVTDLRKGTRYKLKHVKRLREGRTEYQNERNEEA